MNKVTPLKIQDRDFFFFLRRKLIWKEYGGKCVEKNTRMRECAEVAGRSAVNTIKKKKKTLSLRLLIVY